MNILGVDPSMRGFTVCHSYGDFRLLSPPPDRAEGVPMLLYLRDAFEVELVTADFVVLEDYAWAVKPKGKTVIQLAELGGLIRVLLHEMEMPHVLFNPSKLKIIATGNGNASKDEVLANAWRRLGYEGHNKDESDALWLREAALQHYGMSTIKLPQTHTRALQGVAWPTLPGGG